MKVKIEKDEFVSEFTVPEGCKVTVDGKVLLIEPEFKKGDVVLTSMGGIAIIDSRADYGNYAVFALLNNCSIHIPSSCYTVRPKSFATEYEKQQLFDALAKDGKRWNAEKLCIEDLKVEPKVGDCVKAKYPGGSYMGLYKGEGIDTIRICVEELRIHTGLFDRPKSIEILSKDQFQAELNALGFEYDFENDTISELKWKPKEGEFYYFVGVDFTTNSTQFSPAWSSDTRRVSVGNCFKTQEECDNFAKEKGLR